MIEEDLLSRGRRDADAADLGEDIIAGEILPRLPVKSLLRFKSVCTSWRATISDLSFMAAHMNGSKKRPYLAIVPFEGDAINIYRIQRPSPDWNHATHLFGVGIGGNCFKGVQYSNGLMLLCTARELVVCNPSTRDYRFLPHGSPCMRGCLACSCDHAVAGFGFVPGEDVYKVMRYVIRPDGSCLVELLTLGIDSSWRAMAEVPPPCQINTRCANPIASGGVIYFCLLVVVGQLISFDLKSEKFGAIPGPPICPTNGVYGIQMQELEGVLCITDRDARGEVRRVWMYKGDTWYHAFTIRLPDGSHPSYIAGAGRAGKLLIFTEDIMAGRRWLACYHTASKSLRRILDLDEISVVRCLRYRKKYATCLQLVTYVESLMPVPGGCSSA